METDGDACAPMGPHGIYGSQWDSWGIMGTHGRPWGFMGPMSFHGTHGHSWEPMDTHGDPWDPWVPWSPWVPMRTYGDPMGSRARLVGKSSEVAIFESIFKLAKGDGAIGL